MSETVFWINVYWFRVLSRAQCFCRVCMCVLLWLVDHSRPQRIRKNSVALLKAVFPGTPESGFDTQLWHYAWKEISAVLVWPIIFLFSLFFLVKNALSSLKVKKKCLYLRAGRVSSRKGEKKTSVKLSPIKLGPSRWWSGSHISKPLAFVQQSMDTSIDQSPFSTFSVEFAGMVLQH